MKDFFVKKSIIFAALFLFLFPGMALFAQSYDSSPDTVPAGLSVEVAGKFEMTWVKEKEDLTKIFGLGANIRLLGTNAKNIQYGLTIGLSYGFITEMEYMGDAIKRKDADSLYNMSIFGGFGLVVPLIDKLALVSDTGIAFNFDNASWEKVLSNPPSNPSAWSTRYHELNTWRIGLATNAGLRYRFGLVTLEAGATLGYYFMKWNTSEIYTANPKDKNNTKANETTESGNFSWGNNFRITAPYIAVGVKF